MVAATDVPITILIVSHDKSNLLPEAVASVLGQTFENWQGILVDSGLLYEQGFFDRFSWTADPRLRIVKSSETPALRRRKAMAPWCFNECFRRGWVQGELVMYLCDDDLLYPNAFATFVDAFRENPRAMAMYASEDIGQLGSDGCTDKIGARRALAAGGKCCAGRIMDCQVDYLQLCHRRSALSAFPDAEYWPEDRATGDHADGLFMERLGTYWPILPIDITIGLNRRTPWSVNLPTPVIPGARPTKRAHSGAGPSMSAALMSAALAPHETIMDSWAALRRHLDEHVHDDALQKALAAFQGQLRLLCEHDHARRRRLVSQRYRLADRLHSLVARVPGAVSLLTMFAR